MPAAEPDPFVFPAGTVRVGRDAFPVDADRVRPTRLGAVILPPAGAGRSGCLVYADLRRFVPAALDTRPAPAAGSPPARLERVDGVFESRADGPPTGERFALSLWRPVDLPAGARPLAECPPDRLPPLAALERFLAAEPGDDGVGFCPYTVWADPAGLYALHRGAFRHDPATGYDPVPDLRRVAEAYLDGWARRHGHDRPFRELAPADWWDGLTDAHAVAAAAADGRFRFDHRYLGWRARLLAVGRAAAAAAAAAPDDERVPKPVNAGPGADLRFVELLAEADRRARLPPMTADPAAATDPDAALSLADEWSREGYARWADARRLIARLWQAVECLRRTNTDAEHARRSAAERVEAATQLIDARTNDTSHARGLLAQEQAKVAELTELNRQLTVREGQTNAKLARAQESVARLKEQLAERDKWLTDFKQANRELAKRLKSLEEQKGQLTEAELAVAEMSDRAGVPVAIRMAVLGFDLLVAAAVVVGAAAWGGTVTAAGVARGGGVLGWWAAGFWVALVATGLALYSPGYALFGVRRVRVRRLGLEGVDVAQRLVTAVLHRGGVALAAWFALGGAVLPDLAPPAEAGFLPAWWADRTPLRGAGAAGAIALVAWPAVLAVCWFVARLTRALDGDAAPWYRNTTVVERAFGLGFLRLPVAPNGPLAQLLVTTARAARAAG